MSYTVQKAVETKRNNNASKVAHKKMYSQSFIIFFMIMLIEVSIGEIIDKCTILEIKIEEIKDKQKLSFIKKEYDYLASVIISSLDISLDSNIYQDLKKINKIIWDLEDKIRQKEKLNLFDDEFIFYCRSIHRNNEYRANLKKEINLRFKSDFIEVKSYN